MITSTDWLRLPSPLPPDSLLALVVTPPGAFQERGDEASALNRHRQRALETVGKPALRALTAKHLLVDRGISDAAQIALVLNELDSGSSTLSDNLADLLVDWSALPPGIVATRENEGAGVSKRGVVLRIFGAYCLDGTIGPNPELVAVLTGAVHRTLPRLATGIVERNDFKTVLQEETQRRKWGVPRYEVVATSGPAHEQVFQVRVTISPLGAAEAEGTSKKRAEMAAAAEMLTKIRAFHSDAGKARLQPRRTKAMPGAEEHTKELRERLQPRVARLVSGCEDAILQQALTHASYTNEHPEVEGCSSLQTIGAYLVETCAYRAVIRSLWDTCEVSRSHDVASHCISQGAMAELFRQCGLEQPVRLGREQRKAGIPPRVAADILRGIAGACFVCTRETDVALTAWEELAASQLRDAIGMASGSQESPTPGSPLVPKFSPKVALQELTQATGCMPEYRLVRTSGPAHQLEYVSAVKVMPAGARGGGPWLVGRGAGSKRESETSAAEAYLRVARAWALRGAEGATELLRTSPKRANALVDNVGAVVATANLLAREREAVMLARSGLCIASPSAVSVGEGFRLMHRVAHVVSSNSLSVPDLGTAAFLRRATHAAATARQVRSLVELLASQVSNTSPDRWGDVRGDVIRTAERMAAISSLLKHAAGSGIDVSLVKAVEMTAGECGICLTTEVGHRELEVPAIEACLEHVLYEVFSAASDGTASLAVEASEGVPVPVLRVSCAGHTDLQRLIVLASCDDALLACAGIRGWSGSDEGIRLSFVSVPMSPLERAFLEGVRGQVRSVAACAATFHDAKNVISAIEVLWRRYQRDERGRYRRLGEIEERLETLSRSISSLMTESESIRVPNRRMIDIADFVMRYRERVLPSLPPSVDFNTHRDQEGGAIQICVDEELFASALDNLVKNSCESLGSAPGEIALEWIADSDEGRVLLFLRDSGPGMDEKTLHAVLTEGLSTKGPSGGQGLGIRSAIQIVRAHDGDLEIRSSRRGTSAEILLPAWAADTSDEPAYPNDSWETVDEAEINDTREEDT